MDWFDLLAVQGTLKSLLQHHSSKASILRHSAFFRVPLSLSFIVPPTLVQFLPLLGCVQEARDPEKGCHSALLLNTDTCQALLRSQD